MILILSSAADTTTDGVVDWLSTYSASYFRLNADDITDRRFLWNIEEDFFTVGEAHIAFNEIRSVWYRKIHSTHFSKLFHSLEAKSSSLLHYLHQEYLSIINGLCYRLENKNWLTHFQNAELNKLHVLRLARQFSIPIPQTTLVNSQNDIPTDVICKSAYDSMFIKEQQHIAFTMYTEKVDMDKLPTQFFPSLVQKQIKKKYEIRTFYLCGSFFSMAIFSQENKETEVDFRTHHTARPNRTSPYTLPKIISEKLDALLNALGLNCASIDLIRATDNQYYFLEINPTGEFGKLSHQCNYNLHQHVATKLIEMDC